MKKQILALLLVVIATFSMNAQKTVSGVKVDDRRKKPYFKRCRN